MAVDEGVKTEGSSSEKVPTHSRRDFLKKSIFVGLSVLNAGMIVEGDIANRTRGTTEQRSTRLLSSIKERLDIGKSKVYFFFGNHVLTEDHWKEVEARGITEVCGELLPSVIEAEPLSFTIDDSSSMQNYGGLGVGSSATEHRVHLELIHRILNTGKTISTMDGLVSMSPTYPYFPVDKLIHYGKAGVVGALLFMLYKSKESVEEISRRNFLSGMSRILKSVGTLYLFSASSIINLASNSESRGSSGYSDPLDKVSVSDERHNAVITFAERIQKTIFGIESDTYATIRERLVFFRNAIMAQNLWHRLSFLNSESEENLGFFAGSGHSEIESLIMAGPEASESRIQHFSRLILDPNRLRQERDRLRAESAKSDPTIREYNIVPVLSYMISDELNSVFPTLKYEKNRTLVKQSSEPEILIKPAWRIVDQELQELIHSEQEDEIKEVFMRARTNYLLHKMRVYSEREEQMRRMNNQEERHIKVDARVEKEIMRTFTPFDNEGLLFRFGWNGLELTYPNVDESTGEWPVGVVIYNREEQLLVRRPTFDAIGSNGTVDYVTTGTGDLIILNAVEYQIAG